MPTTEYLTLRRTRASGIATDVDAELRPAACAVRSRPQDGAAQARDIERRFGVGLDGHVFFASPGRR